MQKLHRLPFRLVKAEIEETSLRNRKREEFEKISLPAFARIDTANEVPMIELVGEKGQRLTYQKVEIGERGLKYSSSFDLPKIELPNGFELNYASASQFADIISLRKTRVDPKGKITYVIFQSRGIQEVKPRLCGGIRSRWVESQIADLAKEGSGRVQYELDLRTCRVPRNCRAFGMLWLRGEKEGHNHSIEVRERDGFRLEIAKIWKEISIRIESKGELDEERLIAEALGKRRTLEQDSKLFLDRK